MKPSSKPSGGSPREVRLYPLADEWGPKGEPVRAVAACRAGVVYVYGDTLAVGAPEEARESLLRRARASWSHPPRTGWTPFFGRRLQPDVLARAEEHCVSLPDHEWWSLEPPPMKRGPRS